MNREELLRAAWTSGNLEYQVRDHQLPVYEALWGAINDTSVLKYALNIARRFGKTHTSSIIAIEYAIRFPGSIINYAAPTAKEMNKILRSILPVILQDCPPDLKPKRRNGTWEFPNGSIIYTAGVNAQHADDLRGNRADLNIVDEAGQIDELEYLVSSVLLPMQFTCNGTMLLLSTPPSKVDHDFTKMFHECEEEGNSLTLTVHDNLMVRDNPELMAIWAAEYGGINSTSWKREFLCLFVTDTNKIIIPEWELWKERNTLVPLVDDKFQFWRKYVSADLGFKDFTVILFGYYDFTRAKLVIQAEKILVGEEVTSAAVADGTKEIELKLWGPDQKEVTRVADNSDNIFLNDVHRVHKVLFNPVNKDSLQAMVNSLRSFITQGKLEVYPECTYLLGCLEFGVWNKNRDAFASSKRYGHYDGLASLIYLNRYLNENDNPIPPMFGLKRDDVFYIEPKVSKNFAGLSAFNKRKNRSNGFQ